MSEAEEDYGWGVEEDYEDCCDHGVPFSDECGDCDEEETEP